MFFQKNKISYEGDLTNRLFSRTVFDGPKEQFGKRRKLAKLTNHELRVLFPVVHPPPMIFFGDIMQTVVFNI